MAQSFKVCPICGAPAHHSAAVCSTCGTTLTDVQVVRANVADEDRESSKRRVIHYDYRYGETDLLESEVGARGQPALTSVLLALVIVLCGLLAVVFGVQVMGAPTTGQLDATYTARTAQPNVTPSVPMLLTNTPRPSMSLATVTPAPPTATSSPTQGPCVRTVQAGDTLFGLAAQCGHRDLAIIELIVELNELSVPEAIQIGQEIVIPWPTPTVDPNQPVETLPTTSTGIDGQLETVLEAATLPPDQPPTETLQPGVGWHTVRLNETMLAIAVQYGASAEVLSQLNPEVPFLQCDFEFDSGGPRCIVQLIEGQRIRVPVPSPTPTATWTPNGSETPTPSATPTFNAPISLSPGDRTLFQQDQLVTLRWVTTGSLGPNEVYRVRVLDSNSNQEYSADTRELFFIIPIEWQGRQERRHEFIWTVSVIRLESPERPIFTTEPRIFIWESRAASS